MVVDATLVGVKVVINLKGDGDGARGDQGLQHGLLIARPIVASHVHVLAHVRPGTGLVRGARTLLQKKR